MLKFVTENLAYSTNIPSKPLALDLVHSLPISTWRQAPHCKILQDTVSNLPSVTLGPSQSTMWCNGEKGKRSCSIFKTKQNLLKIFLEREEWLSTWASQCRRGEKYVTSKWRVMCWALWERNTNSLEQIISVGIIITREWEWVKASLKKEQLNLRGSESQAS